MLDGRRHSVDIPISKALLALRRIRSLRDPTTGSMSKFCATVDNFNWETTFNDDVSLKFHSGFQDWEADKDSVCGFQSMHTNRGKQNGADCNFYSHFSKTDSIVNPSGNTGLDYFGSNKKESYENNSLSERYSIDHSESTCDLKCITPPDNCFEDLDSCNGPTAGLSQIGSLEHTPSNQRFTYKSNRITGDMVNCVGSPCLSGDDVMMENLGHNSLFVSDEVDVDCRIHGCRLSCCWSRNAKSKELTFHSEVGEHPLFSGEEAEVVLSSQSRSYKNVRNEIVPFSESSKSPSQNFRPRSFSELVGQSMVAKSLSRAISNGRVTPFYLFHGPRGTGKTSAAKIFAAALNCLSLREQRPCGSCKECVLFFFGRSVDVKEVDSERINRTDKVIALMKGATNPPVSSRYKVFIVDECQMLQEETWETLLCGLEGLPQHAVFLMITADLDKLPQNAMSRSQRYYFPKIKDADIASWLGKVCADEGLDFDPVALNFIAAKAYGSVRDAELMLDQLSLLGKKITISLVRELIGIVSDDELLELLNLALSSDAPSTVRRARELMRYRIAPMQLISQLANLIMDILSGTCHDGAFEVRKSFSRRCVSAGSLQKLSHALKVLSEAEKQLKTSKNQTTWLTVALLQLCSVEVSSLDDNESSACLRMQTMGQRGLDAADDVPCSSFPENSKCLSSGTFGNGVSCHLGVPNNNHEEMLDSIWRRATGMCRSKSLKKFLRKRGRLSSVCVDQGLTIAELQFSNPKYVARAENSCKVIASSLQSILNSNVEIRVDLVSLSKSKGVKKSLFSLLSCSQIMKHKSQPTNGIERVDNPDMASGRAIISNKPVKHCDLDHTSQVSQSYFCRSDSATIRDEGNAISTRSMQENTRKGPGSNSFNVCVFSSQKNSSQVNCWYALTCRSCKGVDQ